MNENTLINSGGKQGLLRAAAYEQKSKLQQISYQRRHQGQRNKYRQFVCCSRVCFMIKCTPLWERRLHS